MNEETLFHEALSRSLEERSAFLEQACEGRPELRAAVEALLAAHEKSGNVLDEPPIDQARTVATGSGQARGTATSDHPPEPEVASHPATKTADYGPVSEPGIVIAGHYTLQERIGEGGMGEVWVARQTEPVKRKVALKLIKTGMDSKAVVQRFEQERQTGKPAEAEAEFHRAMAHFRKLVDDNPKVSVYRQGLATAFNHLGVVARKLGRAAEARDDGERAVALGERLVQENPVYRINLAISLRRRGLALADLGDHAGAAADARRALGLFEGLPSRSGEVWFETACCHAALAGQAGRTGSGVSAAEGEEQAARAMGLLRKSVDMGYRNAIALRAESALDPLRERDDFKKILAELENKSPAKPEKGP
jgi:tetratricopeptide (TPR) repeat protein